MQCKQSKCRQRRSAVTQHQIMVANPENNVDELVLCQEDRPQISHSIRPLIDTVDCHMDHFSPWSGLKDQTEGIHYARLSCSRQLLNDVIFIWFTNKNLFELSTLENSHHNSSTVCIRWNKEEIVSEQNAFFAQEWRSVSGCQLSKLVVGLPGI